MVIKLCYNGIILFVFVFLCIILGVNFLFVNVFCNRFFSFNYEICFNKLILIKFLLY